ncbi:hypothetical protein [Marinoscillum luteum]|uniref:Uncharacterized protein n=1 Tax=Marinoscillum luteum TaxID=861051 RepID=A0ABW7N5Y9_9BACT
MAYTIGELAEDCFAPIGIGLLAMTDSTVIAAYAGISFGAT